MSGTISDKKSKLIKILEQFLEKDYGRIIIDKHQNNLYIEITDKIKIK